MDAQKFLTANQVRDRFGGISDVTLYRWLRDDQLAFPRPLVINRRRFFREEEIADWEARRKVEAA
jgi:predicted DNA-binding transcriptional regulator AlpA